MTLTAEPRNSRGYARRRRFVLVAAALFFARGPASALAQQAQPHSAEERTARYFDSIRHDPVLAMLFLREMPKGADLHNHLSGAIYAESYIRWAAQDSMCIELHSSTFVRPPCDVATGRPPAARALEDDALHDQLVDAMSMRNWHPSRGNGHNHFFNSFEKFQSVARSARTGDMLAEATARAAQNRVSYLELMLSPESSNASALGVRIGWDPSFDQLRERLLGNGLRDLVAAARRTLDAAEARQREVHGCATAQRHAACDVMVRYVYSVARARAPEAVFAQMLVGLELAAVDPRMVAINLVQAEDHPIAMRDYSLHMRMIGALQRSYSNAAVTLHAGELTAGLVPPEGLRSHIREAIDIAGARRIGHGVSIVHEDSTEALLRRMARDRIMVEIALGSNDAILGIRGNEHPLSLYLRHGVPIAFVTDDEGVLRSELSLELLKAVREHGLGYRVLKTMARASLQHAFVDDVSKARLLQQLERAFSAFEQKYGDAAQSGRTPH